MHENLDKEEEVKVSSDRSFGIVFTLVFLTVGAWVVSSGQSKEIGRASCRERV